MRKISQASILQEKTLRRTKINYPIEILCDKNSKVKIFDNVLSSKINDDDSIYIYNKRYSKGDYLSYIMGIICKGDLEIEYRNKTKNKEENEIDFSNLSCRKTIRKCKKNQFCKIFLNKNFDGHYEFLEAIGALVEKGKTRRTLLWINTLEKGVFHLEDFFKEEGYCNNNNKWNGVIQDNILVLEKIKVWVKNKFITHNFMWNEKLFNFALNGFPIDYKEVIISRDCLCLKKFSSPSLIFKKIEILLNGIGEYNIKKSQINFLTMYLIGENYIKRNIDVSHIVVPRKIHCGTFPSQNIVFHIEDIKNIVPKDENNKRKNIYKSIKYDVAENNNFLPHYSQEDKSLIHYKPCMSKKIFEKIKKYMNKNEYEERIEECDILIMRYENDIDLLKDLNEMKTKYDDFNAEFEHLFNWKLLEQNGFNPDFYYNLYLILKSDHKKLKIFGIEIDKKCEYLLEHKHFEKEELKSTIKNIFIELKLQAESDEKKIKFIKYWEEKIYKLF